MMESTAEIIVVGGGPGGLSAAIAAAEAGAAVTLLDAYPEPGGQYYHQPPERYRRQYTPRQREGRALWQRALGAGVDIRSRTVVWDMDGERNLSISGPDGLGALRARAVILATGTYERVVAFPGWTLPGVITSGAAQILLYQRVRPGARVLVVGTGPLQLVTAAALVKAGVRVAAVLEGSRAPLAALRYGPRGLLAMLGQGGRIREGFDSLRWLALRGVPYRTGWGIVRAHGQTEVEGATIARLDRDWRPIPGTERAVACDTICVGWGFVPFNALSKMAGAAQAWRPDAPGRRPDAQGRRPDDPGSPVGTEAPVRDECLRTSLPGVYAVGDGAGVGGYRMALLEGKIAGTAAAAELGYGSLGAAEKLRPALRREQSFQRLYAALFAPGPGIFALAEPDTLLCRCEGVTLGQVEAAVREGVTTLREAKASTRCGMGECQGRVCGQQIAQVIARLTGKPVEEVGTYSARPPLFPLPIGVFREDEGDGRGRASPAQGDAPTAVPGRGAANG